jgi:hypothetical protein
VNELVSVYLGVLCTCMNVLRDFLRGLKYPTEMQFLSHLFRSRDEYATAGRIAVHLTRVRVRHFERLLYSDHCMAYVSKLWLASRLQLF